MESIARGPWIPRSGGQALASQRPFGQHNHGVREVIMWRDAPRRDHDAERRATLMRINMTLRQLTLVSVTTALLILAIRHRCQREKSEALSQQAAAEQ